MATLQGAKRQMEIANTIIEQMGGVGKLNAMVGAYQFVATETGVKFRFKMCRKANMIVVEYSPALDLYHIYWYKITDRGLTCNNVDVDRLVYADQLKPIFESYTGLRLSL